jgi:acylphosphatase
LDGYWEVVVQTTSDNFYSRFDLHQSADAVTGVWTRDGKKLPIEGTYGGRQFKFVAKDDAQTLTLTGYIENASDMVGIVDDGSGKTPTAFTASHRGAYRTNILPKRGEKRSSS